MSSGRVERYVAILYSEDVQACREESRVRWAHTRLAITDNDDMDPARIGAKSRRPCTCTIITNPYSIIPNFKVYRGDLKKEERYLDPYQKHRYKTRILKIPASNPRT
jgi:hypothetical protein